MRLPGDRSAILPAELYSDTQVIRDLSVRTKVTVDLPTAHKRSDVEPGGAIAAAIEPDLDPRPPAGQGFHFSPGGWHVTARVFFLFVITLNFFFLLVSSGRVRTRDEFNADLQTESLATRGSTAIPQAVNFFFYGKYDLSGEPQPPYGPAHAAFLVPWYFAGRAILAVASGIPYRARDVVEDATVVASSSTFAALAAGMAFLIFVRLGLSIRVALMAASMLALATPLLSYSAVLYSEPLTCVLLLGAAAALFANRRDVLVSWQEAVLGGILLGTMIWVRPAHVIAAPVFLIALLARDGEKGWRAVRIVAAVVAVFGIAYLCRNHYLFGDFFDFGYPSVSDGGKNMNSFDTPLATGLYGFLFSPGKSVFLFAPPILLAIAGLRKLARLDKGLAVVAGALPVVYLFFYATFTQWEGGFCVGPRYLVPAIAVLCLGLGPMLEKAGAWIWRVALGLSIVGFAVQAINLATSFFEDQANGRYYDAHYNYRMDYAPLVTMTRQLLYYIASPVPAPPGRGFDRWFVFLDKAGVSQVTIGFFLAVELLSFVYFAIWLVEVVQKTPRSAN
jgi:hypothetical protein